MCCFACFASSRVSSAELALWMYRQETSDRRAQEAAEALALCRSELEEAAASSAAIEMRLTEETLARAIGTAREEALQSDQARLEAALAESAANLQIAKSELAAALAALVCPLCVRACKYVRMCAHVVAILAQAMLAQARSFSAPPPRVGVRALHGC